MAKALDLRPGRFLIRHWWVVLLTTAVVMGTTALFTAAAVKVRVANHQADTV